MPTPMRLSKSDAASKAKIIGKIISKEVFAVIIPAAASDTTAASGPAPLLEKIEPVISPRENMQIKPKMFFNELNNFNANNSFIKLLL